MMLIAGVDEAGRGALIGPLVIACVTIEESKEENLRLVGVKDSKQLSPRRRSELYEIIESLSESVVVFRVQPCKIDSYRASGINLDMIEAMKIARAIEMCKAKKVYVDSLEANPEKFKRLILQNLPETFENDVELVVKNYLDESVPVVSAASIVAKVERDAAIEGIKKEVNFDFGTGYPHDPRTIEFVKRWLRENRGKLPPYVRKSWVTAELLKKEVEQRKLSEFS